MIKSNNLCCIDNVFYYLWNLNFNNLLYIRYWNNSNEWDPFLYGINWNNWDYLNAMHKCVIRFNESVMSNVILIFSKRNFWKCHQNGMVSTVASEIKKVEYLWQKCQMKETTIRVCSNTRLVDNWTNNGGCAALQVVARCDSQVRNRLNSRRVYSEKFACFSVFEDILCKSSGSTRVISH